MYIISKWSCFQTFESWLSVHCSAHSIVIPISSSFLLPLLKIRFKNCVLSKWAVLMLISDYWFQCLSSIAFQYIVICNWTKQCILRIYWIYFYIFWTCGTSCMKFGSMNFTYYYIRLIFIYKHSLFCFVFMPRLRKPAILKWLVLCRLGVGLRLKPFSWRRKKRRGKTPYNEVKTVDQCVF